MTKMKHVPTIYLIDTENKHNSYVHELYRTTPDDEVFIMTSLSERAKIASNEVDKIILAPAKVHLDMVYVGTANAMDFQLASLLGFLVSCNLKKRFIIVSKDNGFLKLAEYWQHKGISVHVCDEVGDTKERFLSKTGLVKREIKDTDMVADYTSANCRILVDEAATERATLEDIHVQDGIDPVHEEYTEYEEEPLETQELEEDYETPQEEEETPGEDEESPEPTGGLTFSLSDAEETQETEEAEETQETEEAEQPAEPPVEEVKKVKVQQEKPLTSAQKKAQKREKLKAKQKDTSLCDDLGFSIETDIEDDWLQGENLEFNGEVYKAGTEKVELKEEAEHEKLLQELVKAPRNKARGILDQLTNLCKLEDEGYSFKKNLKLLDDYCATQKSGWQPMLSKSIVSDFVVLLYFSKTSTQAQGLLSRHVNMFPQNVATKTMANKAVKEIVKEFVDGVYKNKYISPSTEQTTQSV